MVYVACVCVLACVPSWGPPLAGSAVPRLPLKDSGRADFPAPLTLFAWLLLCLIPGWISIRIMSTPPSSPPVTLLLFSGPPSPPPPFSLLHLSFPAGCNPSKTSVKFSRWRHTGSLTSTACLWLYLRLIKMFVHPSRDRDHTAAENCDGNHLNIKIFTLECWVTLGLRCWNK